MATGYEWQVSLESPTGFILDTDQLDFQALGFLTTKLDDARVKIRSVSMQGGRNRELDAIQPSTATIIFDNREGLFSPENSSSPYYGLTYPGKLIRLDYINKIPGPYISQVSQFFTGFVSEWSWDFDVNGDAVAIVSAVDTLGSLATIEISDVIAPAEKTGARIQRILLAAGFNEAQFNIQTGISTMAASTVTGNALQLIQQVAFHEQGYLFASGGMIVFFERNNYQEYGNAYFTNLAGQGQPSFFYDGVKMAYSLDSVTNPVTTTSALGTVTASSDADIVLFGEHAVSYETEFATLAEQQNFTRYLADNYGSPQFRPDSLTFSLDKVLDSDAATDSSLAAGLVQLASAAAGTTIRFIFIDSEKGMSNNELLVIASFSHSSTPASYNITMGFEPATWQGVFRLDDRQFGTLDGNKLAF
jgi:hypothetical protein